MHVWGLLRARNALYQLFLVCSGMLIASPTSRLQRFIQRPKGGIACVRDAVVGGEFGFAHINGVQFHLDISCMCCCSGCRA